MNKLKGKVAIVTGASKGIGKGIALEMAEYGATVVVNYLKSKEAANAVVLNIKKRGSEGLAIQGDMSKEEDVKQLFKEVENTFGAIDILVNNAGVYKFESIEDVTENEFHNHFNTNVLGPILTSKEALKYFKKEGGSIINISSVAATQPTIMSTLYTATKAALNGVTEVLAKELGARGIRVNSIMPGLTETEGTHQIGVIGSDTENFMVSNTPLGRTGQPKDVAKVAVFLASDDSAWITGEKIAVSGGF